METGLESRFLTSRWSIIGHEDELAQLTEKAELALDGQGQIIALSSPPGLGKSRLIEEVIRYWLENQGDGFMGQCSHHLKNGPYQVWIDFWQDYFNLPPNISANEHRHKIADFYTHIAPTMAPWIDVLTEILGLPIPNDSVLIDLDAKTHEQKLYQLTLALLKGRSKQHPLLILFENLHWVDKESADLITHVAQNITDSPILLCLLSHEADDIPKEILDLPHCTNLTLEHLPIAKITPLVQAILGKAVVLPKVAKAIFEQTEGIPLYVEEIINNLLASNTLDRNSKHHILTDLSKLAHIPDSLETLIETRLSYLESETYKLAQIAATVGHDFSYALLYQVHSRSMATDAILEHLEKLIINNIITVTETEPSLAYAFKHPLTYKVIYNMVALEERQRLHLKIAKAIETLYDNNLEAYYNLLTHHYQQANVLDKALHYSIKTGERAQGLYANKTALEYYQQAETLLEQLSQEDHWPEAIKLYFNRSQLYHLNNDIPTAEMELDYALMLAQTYHDTHYQAKIYNLKAKFGHTLGKDERIRKNAQQAYDLASTYNYTYEKTEALYYLGVSDMIDAQLEQATKKLKEAYNIALKNHYKALEREALSKVAIVKLEDGYLELSLQAHQQIQATHQKLGLKDKEAHIVFNIAILQFRMNHIDLAMETAQQAIELATIAKAHTLIPYLNLLKVELLTHLGHYHEAREFIDKAYSQFQPEDDVGNAYADLIHAREILLDLGYFEEPKMMLEESLEVMRAHNCYEEMARALVSLGTIYSQEKAWAEAEQYFAEAKDVCLNHRKSWYLSEIYTGLTESQLKQKHLMDAKQSVSTGLQAIRNRSNPNWEGPLLVLAGDVAKQLKRPEEEANQLYWKAIQSAQTRGRSIECNRLFIHAGTQLLAHQDPNIRKTAEALIHEGMIWLGEHGKDMIVLEK